jgi:PAS domain-containing protein
MHTLKKLLRENSKRPFWSRYGCAVVSAALGVYIRLLLDPVLGIHISSVGFLIGVVVAAWYGGGMPALLSLLLGALFTDYFIFPPRGSFGMKGHQGYIELAAYSSVGLCIALFGELLRASSLKSIGKLRTALNNLAQTEERLRLTLRSSGIGVWSWDIAANVVEADENNAALFGLAMGQFPHTVEGFAALVHPGDRERVMQETAASVEQGVEYDTEFRVVWPDGAVRTLVTRGRCTTMKRDIRNGLPAFAGM